MVELGTDIANPMKQFAAWVSANERSTTYRAALQLFWDRCLRMIKEDELPPWKEPHAIPPGAPHAEVKRLKKEKREAVEKQKCFSAGVCLFHCCSLVHQVSWRF